MEAPPDLITEVQELVWALLDEQVSDEQTCRLEQLLQEHEEARSVYLRCMQLHTDLHEFYNPQNRTKPFPPGTSGTPMPIVDLPFPGEQTFQPGP